jgi:NIPSNAP
MKTCCPVIELRQYRLHPGARDALVRIFDEHFVESQERCGMRVIGQFHDLDDPDRFVWLRGFADMESRTRALEAFYGGPVWKEHAAAANATMIDHTDVLLLKPVAGTAGFRFDPRLRPDRDSPIVAGGVVVATIEHLDGPASPDTAPAPDDASGAEVLARLVTETARNGYPRLPVREDTNVRVTFRSYVDAPALQASPIRSPGSPRREVLRLQPTPRSFLRHGLSSPLPTGERAG